MTIDYERLKRLVLVARSIPANERAAWLDTACAGDVALRAEADALLAHDETPDPRITGRVIRERYAADLAAGLGAAAVVIPERIGPYRLCETIGEGGMGIVYRAEQDEPLRREVALKLVRSGLDTGLLVRRLEAERATLARMEHPFIARVFDAGAEPGVGPYVVMELVRGAPITTFCDQHRLSVPQRIELFIRVCEAVHHAHRKGVLHLDLKPSNVLVTDEGRPLPKIIDFGIARALEDAGPSDPSVPADTAGGAPGMTHGVLLGTPEYMSPEQAGLVSGGVDTRSDVYSLGVLLYELLAGRLPFRFPGERAGESAPFDTREVRPPSTGIVDPEVAPARSTTDARLRRALAGDLDAIALMALRREPDRRYASVEHLADDLRRHLDGHTVRARRSTWTYRTASFVQRHPAGAAAAAAVALALVAIAAISVVHSARVERERDRAVAAEARARSEADAARQVAEFLRNLFQGANPSESRGATVTARELVERGVERVDRELEGQPALQARMLRELGEVQHTLGLYAEARALLERSLDRLATAGPNDEERATTLAILGTITHDEGDQGASERFHRDALAIRRRIFGSRHERVAESLNDLAVTLQAAGDLTQAEPYYREALAMNESLLGTRHIDVAWGQSTLGWVLHQQARYAEAESLYRVSLATLLDLVGERHPDVGHTLNNLGGVRYHRGDYAEAEAVWRRALVNYRALYPEGHPAVARAMFNLARVVRARGGVVEADSLNRASLAMSRRMLGDDHPLVVNHMVGLAGTTMERGRPAEAERMLRQARVQRTAHGGAETVPMATLEDALALALVALGRGQEALAFARHALEVRLARQGPEHPDVALSLVALGRAREMAGNDAGADSALTAAIALRQQTLGPDHPLTCEAAGYLGLLRVQDGRSREDLGLMTAAAAGLPKGLALRGEVERAMSSPGSPGSEAGKSPVE